MLDPKTIERHLEDGGSTGSPPAAVAGNSTVSEAAQDATPPKASTNPEAPISATEASDPTTTAPKAQTSNNATSKPDIPEAPTSEISETAVPAPKVPTTVTAPTAGQAPVASPIAAPTTVDFSPVSSPAFSPVGAPVPAHVDPYNPKLGDGSKAAPAGSILEEVESFLNPYHILIIAVVAGLAALLLFWKCCKSWKLRREKQRLRLQSTRVDQVLGDMQMVGMDEYTEDDPELL